MRGVEGKEGSEKGERELQRTERERESMNKTYFFFYIHLMNSEDVYAQPHCSQMLIIFANTYSVEACF